MKLVLIALGLLISSSAFAIEVKILSYNVYMLPKPLKSSMQKIRIHQIASALKYSDYDLIFFEEAFMKSFRDEVKKQMSAQYPYSYYLGKKIPFSIFGSGLLTMSRHPIKLIDKTRFKHCHGVDCWAAKGSPLIDVTLPGGKHVQFAPTHLQAGTKYGPIRLRQITQIKKMLVKNVKTNVPQVVVGDLNLDQTEQEFEAGQTIVNMKALRLSGEIKTTSSLKNECFKTGTIKRWIDHVWVDSNFKPSSTVVVKPFEFIHEGKTCPMSDHYAVESVLRL